MKQAKLIEEVTQIATLKAIEVFNAQKEEEGKKQRDRRLRNTKLLLKNYREFKLYLNKVDEDAKVDIPKILVSEGKNIIDLMTFGEDIVSSIRQTSQKTIAMIQYTDRALETLEFMYERENNSKPFEILSKRYVEGRTIAELAEMFNMNERSIYKALDSATERLSVLLFGPYGVKVE
jgi:hypothetical protein